MADVLVSIEAFSDLDARSKRDLRSGVNSLAKWTHKTPAELQANFRSLQAEFKKLNPVLVGVSKRRFANVRSAVSSALNLAGVPKSNRQTPISPDWRAIVELARKNDKHSIRKFGRYCTGISVSPEQVNDAISSRYLWWLEIAQFLAVPRQKHQTLCRAWNRIAEANNERKLVPLEVPKYRNGYGLPRDFFPASFNEDVDAYCSYLSRTDLFDENAHETELRPKTVKYRRKQIYAAASALVQSGFDIANIINLQTLIEVSNVRFILTYLHTQRHDGKASKSVSDMAQGLFKIAFRYLRVDDDHLEELRKIVRMVKIKQFGMTEKNREVLRRFDDPELVKLLKRIPFEELDAVEKVWKRQAVEGRNQPTAKLAIRYQKALAILILQLAPMRAKNLAGLHLTRHLNWSSSPGRLGITISGNEVKNHEPLRFELPEHATKLVHRYLSTFRSALLRGENYHVFPGENGKAKSENNFSQQIAKLAQDYLGVRLTAYQWRHVMGKIFLDENPGQYEVLRRVFGHKDIDTTVRYYAGEETKSALRLYQESIFDQAEQRKSAEAKPRARIGRNNKQAKKPARK
ncbi:MAG: tyrosine-type recombinase/integrase [Rhizobiaceae bacterium]